MNAVDRLQLSWKDGLALESNNFSVTLFPPSVEVDGIVREGRDLTLLKEDSGNDSVLLRYALTGEAVMEVEARLYPGFVRFRHKLSGKGGRLTKAPESDRFTYTGFTVPRMSYITEVQINQYASVRHAYLPQIIKRRETAWLKELSFAGPVFLAEWNDRATRSLLCAYEHGGEYTDNFLVFNIKNENEIYTVNLECGDGTYCNNTFFNDEHPYITPWFHIGLCKGNSSDMLKQYRFFLLHNQSDSKASREPYIFYNTWNNQERNRAFRGRKYLQDMNTETMLKEIDLAHRINIDVFVIDTGWYRSTGDWEVDLARFPDNLKELRQRLDDYGMKLGLWFNPSAAAVSSCISREHPEYRKQVGGKDVNIGPVWETEESYSMCLVSDYADWFIEKLVSIGERYGVRYFKWDAVDMRGCTAPHHNHGGENVSPEEREKNFRFLCGMALTRIAAEVSRRLPGAIVDLDVTEGRRYVGLGFLAAGKFFHMNNGPYYHDFDIPDAKETYRENWNVFFYPGAVRNQVCRQSLAYDEIIPSVLFLTHFLPDGPSWARRNSLTSLCLGGNGIWGDLHSLSDSEIEETALVLNEYKKVAKDVVEAYPRVSGFIGASPEIHEKINPQTGGGLIAFFTREQIDTVYVTQALEYLPEVIGADGWEVLEGGRLKIAVKLPQNGARLVFFHGKGIHD